MDIVERLRYRKQVLTEDGKVRRSWSATELDLEAADEIERLREALDWALNHIGGHCTYDNVDQVVNCLEKAHAALKGKS